MSLNHHRYYEKLDHLGVYCISNEYWWFVDAAVLMIILLLVLLMLERISSSNDFVSFGEVMVALVVFGIVVTSL